MQEKKQFLILSINPGSTSTKIGLFRNEDNIFETTVKHSINKLEKFPKIWDQYNFRKNEIITTLRNNGYKLEELDGIVARGGLIKPIPRGVYKINEAMLKDAEIGLQGEHASNLGCVIADSISKDFSIPSFITNPPAVDELEPMARISGLANIERNSLFHALNIFATARKFAQDCKKDFFELNLIVAHLGGGITVAALERGKAINVNNGLGEGPFTPERSGGLPLFQFLDLCFSGKYTKNQIKKMLVGKGGLVSYFNTNDALEVEIKAKEDESFRLIFEAMAYQVAQEIGARATNLKGKVDAIILTGGIARSQILNDWIKERVSFISDIHIYPGENELQALALAGLRVLRKEETPKVYQ